jgi:GT2 family glycosyltransferase
MAPKLDQAHVDIVIPTCGRGDLIDTAIISIRRSTWATFSLWVVDQSDDDLTERTVMRHALEDDRIHYIRIGERGASLARNVGAAAGSAPYILFTDDDCRVREDWIGAMVHELRCGETWAVFGQVIPDEHFPQLHNGSAQAVNEGITIAVKVNQNREVYEGHRFNLGFGHGANMAMSRRYYEQLEGFDEELGAGGRFRAWEDRDLGYRVLAQKGRIVYTPRAIIYHRHWRQWNEVRRTYRNYAIGAGAAAAKYLRCGDLGGGYLLIEWMIDQGLRQVVSGIIKWRSWQKVTIGVLQLVYPWVGVAQSLRAEVNPDAKLYLATSPETVHTHV